MKLSTIKKYNTTEWPSALNKWISEKGKLIERYGKVKKDNLLALELSSGKAIKFSPGKHNELQIKIISDFVPRFCPKASLVYVGDTARKILFIDEKILSTLGISITEHNKLPDVVLYDETKNQIFLIEAVTAHGPISPKRQIELENILKNCKVIKIYISVFPDFRELKRHIDNIAWESEGWVADNPDHMIHFNGPKFFSAY